MNDMARPAPLPFASAHDQHDALLVAQLAAGDSLAATQMGEAQALVSGCADCATLAADLGTVSRVVAREPVPPRRRDFRIDAVQAERLEGNAFTRLLRRLTLPSTRLLQPAAAGVLSLGLALVVVGYAWPDGGTVDVGVDADVVPVTLEVQPSAAAASEELQLRAVPPEAEAQDPAAKAQAGDAALVEDKVGLTIVEDDVGATRAEASALANVASEKSMASGLEQTVDPDQLAPVEARSQADFAGDPESAGQAPTAASAAEPGDTAGSELGAEAEVAVASAPAPVDDGPSREEPQAAVDEATGQETNGRSGESLLMAAGLLLALVGGSLLLLVWLARRKADPLLR
jgi:hypothetical protein